MKNLLVTLVVVVAVAVPLHAELKYTTHLEVKKTAAPAEPANPMIGILGDALVKQMVPDGAADIVYLVGDKGARLEFLQAAMGLPAGTVNLMTLDGMLVVLNPKEKTYWKTSVQSTLESMKAAGVAIPEITVKRTGQFETLVGTKCELLRFDWKMAIPIPEGARAALPPDFPTSVAMTGDSCVTTDAYRQYADVVNKGANAMMAVMGFDKIAEGGIALRQRMQLMGLEMQTTVTQIAEEAAPEHAFEIPADYKEVPMPSGGR